MDRWMIKSMDYSVQYWIEIVQSINGKKDKERKREKMIENRNRERGKRSMISKFYSSEFESKQKLDIDKKSIEVFTLKTTII